MRTLRTISSRTIPAVGIFSVAALVLALVSGGTVDRIIVRVVIEWPLLLILAGLGMLMINLIAGGVAAVVAGSRAAAALVAGLIAWSIASPPEFAGLGYHWLLQPAYVVAVAIPWLPLQPSPA